MYFINEIVEYALAQYIWSGCTDTKLRDQVMSHASELIRQVIKKQGLSEIYPGKEESSLGDLHQIAWTQIEKVLYKFRSYPHCRICFNPDRPPDSLLYAQAQYEYGIIMIPELIAMGIDRCFNCGNRISEDHPIAPEGGVYGGSATVLWRGPSKLFNMWSQVSKTVILAHIKKDGRDRVKKGSFVYRNHLRHKTARQIRSSLFDKAPIEQFTDDLRLALRFDSRFDEIPGCLMELVNNDQSPYMNIINKLMELSGMPKPTIKSFMLTVRCMAESFTLPTELSRMPQWLTGRPGGDQETDDAE
jgi:hypothetical protein